MMINWLKQLWANDTFWSLTGLFALLVGQFVSTTWLHYLLGRIAILICAVLFSAAVFRNSRTRK